MAIAEREPVSSEVIISTVFSASDATRSTQTTEQPASASRIALARPLPMPMPELPAPVTMATLLASEREGRGGGVVGVAIAGYCLILYGHTRLVVRLTEIGNQMGCF